MARYENIRGNKERWRFTLHEIDSASRYGSAIDVNSEKCMDDIIEDSNMRGSPTFCKKGKYVPKNETHGHINNFVPLYEGPIYKMAKFDIYRTIGPISVHNYPSDEGPIVHSYLGNLSWSSDDPEEYCSSAWTKIYDLDSDYK